MNNMQVLSAWFGTVECEKGDSSMVCMNERGELAEGANPWVKQLDADMRAMESMEDAQDLLREVGGRWFRVFAEEGLAEWFRAVA
eukprot:7796400-Lingulodinium_polyedra.AAC.1